MKTILNPDIRGTRECDRCGQLYVLPINRRRVCRECWRILNSEVGIEEAYCSNADRIRYMSDEELADWLAKQEYRRVAFDGWLPLCNHVMGAKTCHENGCNACWLEWLKRGCDHEDS